MKKTAEDHGDMGSENLETKVSEKQIASSKRMQVLSSKVSEAIKQADEETEGEFTMTEIQFVMTKTANMYGTHCLKNEWS